VEVGCWARDQGTFSTHLGRLEPPGDLTSPRSQTSVTEKPTAKLGPAHAPSWTGAVPLAVVRGGDIRRGRDGADRRRRPLPSDSGPIASGSGGQSADAGDARTAAPTDQ